MIDESGSVCVCECVSDIYVTYGEDNKSSAATLEHRVLSLRAIGFSWSGFGRLSTRI